MSQPLNFSNQDLRNRSFRGCDLVGADFRKADIRSCDFSGANLEGADFSEAIAGQSGKQIFSKVSDAFLHTAFLVTLGIALVSFLYAIGSALVSTHDIKVIAFIICIGCIGMLLREFLNNFLSASKFAIVFVVAISLLIIGALLGLRG